MRPSVGASIAVLLWPLLALAQDTSLTITSAVVTNPRQVMVVFSHPLTSSGTAPQFTLVRARLLPDNEVPITITQNLIATNTLALTFRAVPEPSAKICFDEVQFLSPDKSEASSSKVCSDLSRDPAALKATWLAALQKTPRTSRDKDIFASGFVTTSSEESAGGADLSFNPDFKIPNLTGFLQIKKATATEGDARNFEAGARYRYTGTWRPSEIRAIAAASTDADVNRLIRERQNNIMAGWLFDFAGKLEGDPTNFDVTNFVTESAFQLRTMTRGFLGRKGFWRGFLLPGGFELGQSVGTTVPAATGAGPAPAAAPADVNRIGRYKAGAGFTLYYDNPGAALPLQRVEVDVNGVMRHLFWAESRFNPDTKKSDITANGLHGYAQVDLKVFFVQTDAGRYGFKLSFNRGRLPPVYSEVKSFDFGFVIESGDDDGKATAERRAGAAGRSRK